MAIVRRRGDRSAPLGRLQDEVNDLFGRFFEDWPLGAARRGLWWPALDVADNENEVVLHAELPGMTRDDIDIAVQGNVLTISGEKKQSNEHKDASYCHVERTYGSFRRDVELPAPVDAGKTEATYRDGVLTVKLPKTEQAKSRRIEVKS
ncbi:MAG: Hsp20/alpha crystallin family protein [Phycisphaerae bacterium]|nr:Hsp20/alpha crystallin family protein [Phycisphaerae bacterium]